MFFIRKPFYCFQNCIAIFFMFFMSFMVKYNYYTVSKSGNDNSYPVNLVRQEAVLYKLVRIQSREFAICLGNERR